MARRRSRRIRIETTLTETATPAFVVDAQRRVVFFNKGLERLTGWTASDVVGAVCEFVSVGDAHLLEALTGAICPPDEVLRGTALRVQRHLVHRTTGRAVARLLHFFPITDDEGVSSVLGLATDLPAAGRSADTSPLTQVHAELAALRHELRERYGETSLLGRSGSMQRVVRQIQLARSGMAAVHVSGEAGTGCEHVARMIHYSSELKQRAFVPIDCRALPTVELTRTIGRLIDTDWSEISTITALQPGCVLFHNVDELPRELQQRICSFLLTPEGMAFRERVRLITASHCDIDRMLADDRILPEFYYEITTFRIGLPPLRERPEDIVILAQHFLESGNRRRDRQLTGFSAESLAQFQNYNWPGNVAELEQVVREAVAQCDGSVVKNEHLPFRFRTGVDAQTLGPSPAAAFPALADVLARVERDHIETALQRSRGNRAQAAKLVGLTRAAFYRRLESLGIATDDTSDPAS